jgi:DNA topoisomerase I
VNQGKVNATLPKTLPPEDVTLEQALELIAARAAATGNKKPARKAAKKAPAKKAAAKKPAATKPAAKKKTVEA